MSRTITITLVAILAASCVIMFESASAAPMLQPSVPEFTMKYVDNSYDVPPTYEKDQYTGQQIITHEGYHVDRRMIEFTIKNPPFTAYNDSDGNTIRLYYNFRFKGTYGDQWTYHPFNQDGTSTRMYGGLANLADYFPDYSASSSVETVLPIPLTSFSGGIPNGYPVEFQVQTQIGYITGTGVSMAMGSSYEFTGQSSDWSSTQKIIIGETAASPSPTASVPEFPASIILPLLVVIPLVLTLILRKKSPKSSIK